MMRFPLQLTSQLVIAWLAQKLRLAQGIRSIQFVDAAEMLHPDSSHPVSHEKIRAIIGSRAPVVWIGGSEPLHHPGIAHLVRAITHSGHFVFLETDGTLLRRRIHEFQPVSRLFLTVRLESGAPLHTTSGLSLGASELAVEGIRAARLSGFSICVYGRVTTETEMCEVAELIHLAHSNDVDGIVISQASGGSKSVSPGSPALQRKTAEARKWIESKWWESFSRLVEPIASGERGAMCSASEAGVRTEQESNAHEESVKVA